MKEEFLSFGSQGIALTLIYSSSKLTMLLSSESNIDIHREYREIIRNVIAGGAQNETELPIFSLRSILATTSNFSQANKLGEGGFDHVYKGILPKNQEVAILSKKFGQGYKEFTNELKLIAKLQLTNLVRLLGCYIEEEELILIYEYMPNRSLDKFVFGVLYIHKHSRLKIIHRDLKASNALLDAEMNPKISDLRMAKIFDMNQTEANTNRVVGMYDYMFPEYACYDHFSEKLDVFSSWKLWKEGKGVEVINASMRETCLSHEALRCIHVAFLCVQEAPADPPAMSSIVHLLVNEATPIPLFKELAYSMETTFGDVSSSPSNGVTITIPESR
ncbi:putative protein kinase RLK-Pelle-L-LEC family [Rosa chinensis]|uniref:non-specific serine/threonine protein kinase n=1 Tax=Rosa chinensis TaxID=74649 RepID=A0A2P6QJB1_ROSCH|nr:putative protein kinase RLK-Pelle-L-LEC family [Rosa chinensis]